MKLTCFITGKIQSIKDDKLPTWIKKYKTSENLERYFITSAAEKLLKKGYTIEEIRKQLEIDDKELQASFELQDRVAFHVTSNMKYSDTETDPKVALLINRLRDSKL